MQTALLIIDIQNEYFPSGNMELEGALSASLQAGALLQCFRQHKGRTVHIQHESLKPNSKIFLRGTKGIAIHDSVAHFEGEPLIVKNFPNAFRETHLAEMLSQWKVERLVICGMMTHLCVDATARVAGDLGYQIIVASDACATRALTFEGSAISAGSVHKAFLAALNSYGQVMLTEAVISLLAAEHQVSIKGTKSSLRL